MVIFSSRRSVCAGLHRYCATCGQLHNSSARVKIIFHSQKYTDPCQKATGKAPRHLIFRIFWSFSDKFWANTSKFMILGPFKIALVILGICCSHLLIMVISGHFSHFWGHFSLSLHGHILYGSWSRIDHSLSITMPCDNNPPPLITTLSGFPPTQRLGNHPSLIVNGGINLPFADSFSLVLLLSV